MSKAGDRHAYMVRGELGVRLHDQPVSAVTRTAASGGAHMFHFAQVVAEDFLSANVIRGDHA
ncbi:hypothetical protein PF003_g14789 [Phytophthora fragariae]|nr:hypothetical protein PF003_g14789 [Phytophthora fragariae]